MTTYAINTTRGKEFAVESELKSLGLHPWGPRGLVCRYVKEKRENVWYDRPYVGKLVFCLIPAIYWPDVVGLKHVIGKPLALSHQDIQGIPAHTKEWGEKIPAVPGLVDFKAAVEAEYADMKRRKLNSEYECQYTPGQALTILDGPFEDFHAVFKASLKRAHDDYHKLQVSVEIFGRETSVEVDPDKVRVL